MRILKCLGRCHPSVFENVQNSTLFMLFYLFFKIFFDIRTKKNNTLLNDFFLLKCSYRFLYVSLPNCCAFNKYIQQYIFLIILRIVILPLFVNAPMIVEQHFFLPNQVVSNNKRTQIQKSIYYVYYYNKIVNYYSKEVFFVL